MVVVNVLLDLRLTLSLGRLVDRHFNVFVVVGDHNGPQRAELSMNHLVVHTPKPMKTQDFFVVAHYRLHLLIRLVSYYVVYLQEIDWRDQFVQFLFKMMRLESRQEEALVVLSLDKGVNSISVSPNSGHHHSSILI